MKEVEGRRSGSIRSQIIWTFGLLLLLETLVFGILSGNLLELSISGTNEKYMTEFVSHLLRVTDNYISNLEDISEVVTHFPEIREFLNAGSAADRESISSILYSVKTSRSDITSIILINSEGELLSDSTSDTYNLSRDFREETWYRTLNSQNSQQFFLTASHVQTLIDKEYPWVISLFRKVGQGYIVVDLNYSVIEELCSNLDIGGKGYIFIVNDWGEMVYHPRIDLIYSDLKVEKTDQIIEKQSGRMETVIGGRDVLYTFDSSDLTGWSIISTAYISEFNTNLEQLKFFQWLILICTMMGTVLLGMIISAQITHPIEVLRSSMQEVEKGNFDIDISLNCDNEVSDLAQDCDIAIKTIKDLIHERVREQEVKRKHELEALQAQINPHFLYNTLDSIIWLTEADRNDDAVAMTEQLALFFRLSLSKGEEFVPVKQILDHLESYLSIQKMRYKTTLDYSIDFDENILDLYTLKLLIQPLVENSIYHGLRHRKGTGQIWISGCRNSDEILEFRVEDNGAGMDPSVMKRINSGDYSHFSRSGVGIRNVAERIQLSYGSDPFGVRFHERNEGGTVAIILLPADHYTDRENRHV